ncbi:MAG: endonuclease/exonuclease/phosphatase family protein [Planctomycetaceae bacterium]|nr:endonuclease/exonuclease/phosphatase family protein [Planctomycetaceae bacterium]
MTVGPHLVSLMAATIVVFTAHAFGASGIDAFEGESQTPSIRVMSFNIRFGTANDGENHWKHRQEFVAETIRAWSPDLLGTQETLKFQRDFLAEKLPEYGVIGVGRNDGKDDGEMMALFYRKDRFDVLDSGHFWLSETPEKIGSQSWDSSLPRMATWVRLRDRQHPDSQPVMYLNTHFDHRGQEARRQSALLIRRRASEAVSDGCRIIVTGDFNAGFGSQPYEALFSASDGSASPVVDTWSSIHPQVTPEEGTFSGFQSSGTKGARIDWIAVSRDWKVLDAGIDRTERDGRTPSDHFPVYAILQAR